MGLAKSVRDALWSGLVVSAFGALANLVVLVLALRGGSGGPDSWDGLRTFGIAASLLLTLAIALLSVRGLRRPERRDLRTLRGLAVVGALLSVGGSAGLLAMLILVAQCSAALSATAPGKAA